MTVGPFPHARPARSLAFPPGERSAGAMPSPGLPRRRFLTSIGALALASQAQPAEPGSSLTAAVIGHTGRGDFGHGLERIFLGRPGIRTVAVADPDPAGRERVAKALEGARPYGDWGEMLEAERPRLVSIAMRHADQHAEIALGCLRRGAHVYIEKPFVRSPAEADEVLALAERRDRQVAVAHTMRMMPVVRRFHQAVREGVIGELREMRAFGKQDARAGGEDMMVLGSHLFDLMRMFAGDPEWVTARVLQGSRDVDRSDRRLTKDNVGWVAGDRVFAQFAFKSGINATFTSDAALRDSTGHWGIEFHGSRGVARLNGDISPNVFLRTAGAWKETGRTDEWKPLDPSLVKSAPEHNVGPVRDWLDAVARGTGPECSGRNGAWAVEMVCGVYRSALSGARIRLPLEERRHPLD